MKYPVKALFFFLNKCNRGNFKSIHMHTQSKAWETGRTRNYKYFLEEEQCQFGAILQTAVLLLGPTLGCSP